MRSYDPYKKTILFFASLINIIIMCALFAYVWYGYYADTMFVYSFYRRGNYVIIAFYGLLLFFFSNMYGGLKIGQLRRMELLLSEYLSLFFTNVVAYIVISLLAFRFVSPLWMFGLMFMEMLLSSFWNIMVIHVYNHIFQPWKLLLIYEGEHSARNLVNKVETRRDKYAIYDAVNIDEGMDVIADKIKDFQAVIIGDISAVKRNDMLKYCYANQIRAYVVPKLSDVILMGGDQIRVFDTPFLLVRDYAMSFDRRLLKRLLDLLLAVPLLLLTSWLMLLIALLIKLTDGGPVFYKQTRLTRNNKEFQIYKFRSMVVDAERDGVARLAGKNDERVTGVGRFLRATRMDELPQLFNILRGDMSFVGPRPERPEIAEQYSKDMPEFHFRTRVKAGLTGYAQVYGKYNTTPYDKLKLDLYYIENYSFWNDIKLILMTIKTVLKKSATDGVQEGQQTALAESSATEMETPEELVQEMVSAREQGK